VCGDQPVIPIHSTDSIVVDGLCQDPGQLRSFDSPPERVVVALHHDRYHLPDLQNALRSIDIDPLGAQLLDVGEERDAVELGVAVLGLRARAAAFDRSVPENAKPFFPRSVTRRGFLRPPVPAYVSAPRINDAICAADSGCRACVVVCPQDALEWRSGRMAYEKDICVPCGRCVTACPTGAVENPAVTPAIIDAQVRALVAARGEPVGIRFVCSRGATVPVRGWSDLSVPCTSMVPGSWLLATLLLGAGGAHAVPCSESGCSIDLDIGAIQANDLAHTVLRESGFDPTMLSGVFVDGPLAMTDIEDPFGSHGAANVMMALESMTTTSIDVRHEAANTGVVTIDASACTLCGQCAMTCPTHALVELYEDDIVSISFDARACVNCSQCVSACPEIERGAIAVEGRIDGALLTAGRQNLHQGTVAVCEVCGNAIAPSTMMSRIGDLLGDDFAATMAMLENRCLDCRGRR
jgi:ferredoxin